MTTSTSWRRRLTRVVAALSLRRPYIDCTAVTRAINLSANLPRYEAYTASGEVVKRPVMRVAESRAGVPRCARRRIFDPLSIRSSAAHLCTLYQRRNFLLKNEGYKNGTCTRRRSEKICEIFCAEWCIFSRIRKRKSLSVASWTTCAT